MKFANAIELIANFAGFAAIVNQARIDELGPNAVPPITPEPYWTLEDKRDADGKVVKIHATYNGKKDYATLLAMASELLMADVTSKWNSAKGRLEITPKRGSVEKVNTYGGAQPKADTLRARQDATRVYMRLLNAKVDGKPNDIALGWNPYTVVPCIVRLLEIDGNTVANLTTETVNELYNTEKPDSKETTEPVTDSKGETETTEPVTDSKEETVS